MKRTLLLGLLLALLCCGESYAQRQFRKPLKSNNYQSILGFSNYNIGLKIGCPWNYLTKSDLNATVNEGHFGYLVGFIGERNLGKWSVAIESTFAQRGTKMYNERRYQISFTQFGTLRTEYEVAYNVVTARIPITYYFKGVIKEDHVVPYVFAGPEIDIPLRKVLAVTRRYEGPNGDIPLPENPHEFQPGINVSMAAGVGLMSKIRFENSAIIFKIDAAYNRGLMNLGVPTKEALNWLFKEQDRQIFAHNLEVNFSIVYPIKKILHDACYNFD